MTEPAKPLRCIVCGTQPDPFGDFAEGTHQPYGATMFNSRGHDGSTVWDPMSGGQVLMLNVCDKCLVVRKERLAVVRTVQQEPTYEWAPWAPRLGGGDD